MVLDVHKFVSNVDERRVKSIGIVERVDDAVPARGQTDENKDRAGYA